MDESINSVDASINALGIIVACAELLDNQSAATPVAVKNLFLRGTMLCKFMVIALDGLHPIVQIGDLPT